MGTIQHHALVVTCYREEADTIRRKAHSIFEGDLVSPVVAGHANGYRSFFVAPDGSKEGWETSNRYEKCRNEFVTWLEANDDAIHADWVEVTFGDHGANVTRSSVEIRKLEK